MILTFYSLNLGPKKVIQLTLAQIYVTLLDSIIIILSSILIFTSKHFDKDSSPRKLPNTTKDL